MSAESLQAILADATSMAKSKLFTEDVTALSLNDMVQSHILLKALASAIEARLTEFKGPLKGFVELKGAKNDKGTQTLLVEGSSVSIEHKRASLPDDSKLRELLALKEISITDGFDEVKTLNVNPSKVDFLIQTGKLKADEVDAIVPHLTPALKIKASPDLQEKLIGLGLKKG